MADHGTDNRDLAYDTENTVSTDTVIFPSPIFVGWLMTVRAEMLLWAISVLTSLLGELLVPKMLHIPVYEKSHQ